jgi:hypothetical protein
MSYFKNKMNKMHNLNHCLLRNADLSRQKEKGQCWDRSFKDIHSHKMMSLGLGGNSKAPFGRWHNSEYIGLNNNVTIIFARDTHPLSSSIPTPWAPFLDTGNVWL